MTGPLSAALSTFEDAIRIHTSATRAAQERWNDTAQRSYWAQVVQEIDREQQQYRVALIHLDAELAQALRLLDT